MWITEWLRIAADRSVLQRCILTALVVGTVLTLITQADVLFSPRWDAAVGMQVGLLYVVPYLVSSVASVSAIRQQRRIDQDNLLLTGQQLEAINRFPNQNPNPVMRISRDGQLMYANAASTPILSGQSLTVGAQLPPDLLRDLRRAADAGDEVDVRSGTQTFALLPVHVPEFDFMNVYGTDVTAAKVVGKFPNENPNPVLRMDTQGTLIYANAASAGIVNALGVAIGEPIPAEMADRLRVAYAGELPDPIEVQYDGRTYTLKPVLIEEFGFTNIYGTDVTATKAVDKFPNQNPNPVLRMTRDGRLTYANPASVLVRKALRTEVGDDLPPAFRGQIQHLLEADAPGTLEVEADGRTYELLVVSVYEFDSINLYGTDVTAARQIERLARENERLLLNILPASIAERLRGGETVIADRFDELTVLFADCVGFTEMSSRLPPAEVVDHLNRVFSAFDRLADQYGLEKIKTIGDAYMVAGGLQPAGDHPERVAAMGLEMLAEVKRLRVSSFPGLEVRIGMHVGPAVAGVIGIKKFIYDVWGDTVNVASRMETLGEAGRLQVAESTYRRLRHAFEIEPRGTIEVKGLGPTMTYYVTGRRR
jgi:class 3 adenylate cyclase